MKKMVAVIIMLTLLGVGLSVEGMMIYTIWGLGFIVIMLLGYNFLKIIDKLATFFRGHKSAPLFATIDSVRLQITAIGLFVALNMVQFDSLINI